jgi:hypothetical protein
MMPDGIAFAVTSSNERGGVPSAKKRFPAVSVADELLGFFSAGKTKQ